jgi:adenine-specific DNA-methyltransferase
MDWKHNDREFDTIYVNGDNNLDNLRKDEDHFKVKLIEQEFKRLMFNE